MGVKYLIQKAGPVGALVLVLVLFGLITFFTYKDFGITFDEKTEYRSAAQLKEHFAQKTSYENTIVNEYQLEPKLRYHAPLLSPYYRFYLSTLSTLNPSGSYTKFHFLNMLICGSVLIIAVYLIIYKFTKSALYAVAASVFVFALPRIFGDLAQNPKDIPFAVFYLLAIAAIYVVGKIKFNFIPIFVLGLIFSFAQSFRIIGFTLYFIFFVYQSYLILREQKAFNFKKYLAEIAKIVPALVMIFIVANFFMVVTWPYLGANYFIGLRQLFFGAADFDHWDDQILYLGQIYTKDTRPWHYLFVWLGITTPAYVLLPLLLSFFSRKVSSLYNELRVLCFTALFTTFALYLIVNPVVYNGPRHFLFIYPIMGVLAFATLYELLRSKTLKYIEFTILFVVIASFSFTLIKLISLHPFQYVYFNELSGGLEEVGGRFEIDYWAASYKESIDWVNAKSIEDKRDYKIFTCDNTTSVDFFKGRWIERVKNISEADYYICAADKTPNPGQVGELVYTVQRDSVPLNFVIKPSSHQLPK